MGSPERPGLPLGRAPIDSRAVRLLAPGSSSRMPGKAFTVLLQRRGVRLPRDPGESRTTDAHTEKTVGYGDPLIPLVKGHPLWLCSLDTVSLDG